MLKPEDIFGLGLWQPFKVASGGAPPAYSVVSLSGGDKDGRYFVNTAAKPSTTLKSKYGITGPFDITATGSDKRGVVCTAGYALVKYGDSSIAVDDFCGPKPDSWVLWKNHPGFRCVKVIDATNKIMLAERIDAQHLLGKRASNVSKGSSGEFVIWLKTGSSHTVWEASTFVLTAECLTAAYTANKWAKLELIAGKWIAGQIEC